MVQVIGLTGGIGMGKSTAAGLLQAAGVQVVDTDDLARDLVRPGEPALIEVVREFGAQILDSNGRLQRDHLARIVFAEPEARVRLETILHPRIQQKWQTQLQTWRDARVDFAGVIIPLLFETKAQSHFDSVVCLACSDRTQAQRLASRGWSDEQIRQRLAAQMSITDKMAHSDQVVWTEGSIGAHAEQWRRILQGLASFPRK